MSFRFASVTISVSHALRTAMAWGLFAWGAAAQPAVAAEPPSSQPGVAEQRISVQDLVRYARFGDPLTLHYLGDEAQEPGIYSPDRSRVAVLLRRGNPENGTNDATLLVYEMKDIFDEPEPRVIVEFASRSNYHPMANIRWRDHETLVFSATRDDAPPQVYEANLRNGKITQVGQQTSPLYWYDLTDSGRHLVTVSEVPEMPWVHEDPECRHRGCLVERTHLYLAERGMGESMIQVNHLDLRTRATRTMPTLKGEARGLLHCDFRLMSRISPDGRYGLQGCIVKEDSMPGSWAEYTMDADYQEYLSRNNPTYGRKVFIHDFQTGQQRPLIESPWLFHLPEPVWLENGRELAMVGLEPLDTTQGAERIARASHYALLLIEPVSGTRTRIDRLPQRVSRVTALLWNAQGQELTVQAKAADDTALAPIRYRRDGTAWRPLPDAIADKASMAARGDRVTLVVSQSVNDPPVLTVVDEDRGLRRVLMDPNDWLADRRRSRVEILRWPVGGEEWVGGLYYPPDYSPKIRYPVLLQTHGFDPKLFSLTGHSRNFAAQAVAAQGIMVLQVGERPGAAFGGREEWPAVQKGYEGAIDMLDARGLIDRSRVGLLGWSRSGCYVGYMLTHSDYPVAAAAFTDTGDIGWWFYMAIGADRAYDESYQTSPFGEGLDVWKEYSPTFNLDRVRAPMLMWSNGAVWGLWDWHVGLRRLGKPVEYWVLPDGAHEVVQVPQRIDTTQRLVDWFRFWLKDEIDPDEAKLKQYERWRKLRALQDQQQAQRSAAS